MRGGCSLIVLLTPDLHGCTRRPRACWQTWLVMCRVGIWLSCSGRTGLVWCTLNTLAQRQRMSGQQLRDSQPEPYDLDGGERFKPRHARPLRSALLALVAALVAVL